MRLTSTFALAVGVFAACSAVRCDGKLWESMDEMKVRFGPPIADLLDDSPFGDIHGLFQQAYERGGIRCFAYFANNKCLCEIYQRSDNDWLSEGEMQTVLEANQFGKEWHHQKDSSGMSFWVKDDSSARCACMKGDSSRLIVFTVPWFDEAMSKDKENATAKEKRSTSFLSDPVSTPATAKPTPAASSALPSVDDALRGVLPTSTPSFQESVARSQRAAVKRYPQLAVAGSAMNEKFLARYNVWKARRDVRLNSSDWPEKLAVDCATSP